MPPFWPFQVKAKKKMARNGMFCRFGGICFFLGLKMFVRNGEGLSLECISPKCTRDGTCQKKTSNLWLTDGFHRLLSNAGKYWSNGMDLRFLDTCSTEEMSTLQRDTNQLMARTVRILMMMLLLLLLLVVVVKVHITTAFVGETGYLSCRALVIYIAQAFLDEPTFSLDLCFSNNCRLATAAGCS